MSRSTFRAKYDGRCAGACGEVITKGDELVADGGEVMHADCLPDDADPNPQRPTCPDCWQIVAVNGECGCA